MKPASKTNGDLPLEQRALTALRVAVRKAIAHRHELGLPAYVWRNGRIEELQPPRTRTTRSNRVSSAASAGRRVRKSRS